MRARKANVYHFNVRESGSRPWFLGSVTAMTRVGALHIAKLRWPQWARQLYVADVARNVRALVGQ